MIKKIIEKPFHKQVVKKLPIDAKYKQQDVNDNEIYYSELKKSYYVSIK
jgi:hypothetical protein